MTIIYLWIENNDNDLPGDQGRDDTETLLHLVQLYLSPVHSSQSFWACCSELCLAHLACQVPFQKQQLPQQFVTCHS